MTKELLWNKALIVSNKAILNSSLRPLQTNTELVTNDINEIYELRTLKKQLEIFDKYIGPKINPFDPPDKALFVDKILDKHRLILNKYPVQIGHMLLITNNWKPQSGWLEANDFKALVNVNNDTNGLWFFNSGPKAGASQPHRHLQLLPRKTYENFCPRDTWFEERINNKLSSNNIKSILERSMIIDKVFDQLNDNTGVGLYNKYLELCRKLKVGDPDKDYYPNVQYNLIITRNWISIIRRSKESSNGFSINSLGFAGYLLCTNKSDIRWLQTNGIEKLLNEVVNPLNDNNY